MIGAAILGLTVLSAGPAAPDALAQYFGRNKVRYASFDFEVLKTEHFDIYFNSDEAEAVEYAGRMMERWYSRLSRLLDHELRGRQPLILYSAHPQFEQTNAISGELSEATGGVTEIFKRRIVLPFAGPLGETDHVLGHELVHAFQFSITGQGRNDAALLVPSAVRLPLWFIEGMAEFLTLGPVDPQTAMWMRESARDKDLPFVSELWNPRYFPYRYGQSLWAYIAGRWGDQTVGQLLKVAGQTVDAQVAIQEVLEITSDSLSIAWHNALRRQYDAVAAVTDTVAGLATKIIGPDITGGNLNIAPAISPNGEYLVYLSERGLFSIDMYLADARTGEIQRRLTRTASDPHFESLQFINSAGAWSADGRLFAFGGITKGKPVISIIEAESGDRVKDLRVGEVDEIFNPTWSPDGRSIAFSAIQGGLLDLWVIDVADGELRRLTADPFAEMMPDWSPDGSRIAFVTDRFGANFETLQMGDYRLALIDPNTGQIEVVPGFSEGKDINPQWSSDGSNLFFISDRGGISNLYRVELSTGRIFQLTDLLGGVSGITSISPALSVAEQTDKLVFSSYEGGSYSIYTFDEAAELAGQPPEFLDAAVNPAALPPEQRATEELEVLLDNPELGLPDALTFSVQNYKPGLGLDYIAQPSLGLAVGGNGFFFGGGAGLFWSDMLGDHNLSTFFTISNEGGNFLRSTAAVAQYTNRSKRIAWGGAVSQVPLIIRDFAFFTGTIDGQPVDIQQELREWQVNREVSGILQYPFNRSQRVELSAGFRNIDFSSEVRTRAFNLSTGEVILDEREPLAADTLSSLNLVVGSVALVYDKSIFGGTSPVLGQRYRFEASPVVGSLDYVNLLGDYRRYLMPVMPLTVAFRLMTVGRYGSGAEDPRLVPFYIGYPFLVRGYDDGSFSSRECNIVPGQISTCPVYDNLFGSRFGVFNFELRLPLLGALGVFPAQGAPPAEIGTFFDAGLAGGRFRRTAIGVGSQLVEIDHTPVTSLGGFMRLNLFGFAIVELDYVWPMDRPEKNPYFVFQFNPGF
jgi:Tol biopolymer transport system component